MSHSRTAYKLGIDTLTPRNDEASGGDLILDNFEVGADLIEAAQNAMSAHTALTTTAHGGIVPSSRTVSTTTPLQGGGALSGNLTLSLDQTALVIAESQVTNLVTDLGAKVPTSRTISTTAPLSGGGALSSNLTLTIANVTTTTDGTMTAADKVKLNGVATGATANTGTVTSVGLTLPSDFSVSGSPVTTSGSLSAAWASQTTNKVLAAPNGSTGTPSFRALVAADIPTLTLAKISDAGTAAAVNTGTTSGTIPVLGASGLLATARMGSGTASNSTYLRGDNTWATIAASQWTTSGSNIYFNTGNVTVGGTNGALGGKLNIQNGDIDIDLTGATETTPAGILMKFVGAVDGQGAAITFGDAQNRLHTAYSRGMNLTSYWPMVLAGNHQGNPPGLVNGTGASVTILNNCTQNNGSIGPTLILRCDNDQSANVLEWGTADYDGEGNGSQIGYIDASGNITTNGKLTAGGGIDPPYVLYDLETQDDIVARVAREVPDAKKSGLALWYDGSSLRAFQPSNGKHYTIAMTEVTA